MTSRGGRVILVGVPKSGENINIFSLPLHFGKILKGSHGGNSLPEYDIPRYMRLQKAGKIDLKSLVTCHYELDEINIAIEDMKSGKTAGRIMINL